MTRKAKPYQFRSERRAKVQNLCGMIIIIAAIVCVAAFMVAATAHSVPVIIGAGAAFSLSFAAATVAFVTGHDA